MVAAPKKAVKKAAAPKKAAVPKLDTANPNDPVVVNNISERLINTTYGSILPGESGKATPAECRQLNKYLEKA